MNISPQRIMDMSCAFYDSCVLFAACELGIFAYLGKAGRADLAAISRALSLSERGCRLLLDACVALGLLGKEEGRFYRNSAEAAAFLVPGSPGDLTQALRYNRDVYAAWGRLSDFVRRGQPVERPETHLGDDPARTRAFVLAMHGRALAIGQAVVPMLELGACRNVLEVGGGPGTYSCLIAQRYPRLKCTVIDLPAVAAIASDLIAQQGLSERVQPLGGDYHTTAFPPCDAALFFGVLHQESAEEIEQLLKRAYAALAPGGVLYVMDMMTDASRAAPRFSALFAVNMALTATHGWVFSDDDLKAWLQKAGFEEIVIKPLPSPMPHWLARAIKI